MVSELDEEELAELIEDAMAESPSKMPSPILLQGQSGNQVLTGGNPSIEREHRSTRRTPEDERVTSRNDRGTQEGISSVVLCDDCSPVTRRCSDFDTSGCVLGNHSASAELFNYLAEIIFLCQRISLIV